MRLGIVMIPQGTVATEDGLAERIGTYARRVEALGFSGLWVTDAFGRGRPTLDPLTLLGMLSAETKSIELGTCVVQIPLRHPVEHAQRVMTLHLLSRGRLRFGVGAGSTKADFDAVGANYDARFKTLPAYLETMRRTWNGDGPLTVWPAAQGGPPVMLGAWRSQRWINLAAKHCQGWIGSGIYTNEADLEIGIGMYRKAGGTRAILANVFTDFRTDAPPNPMLANAKISLTGTPAAARETLRRLEQLGLDDALLVCPIDAPEQLEIARGLI